MVFKDAEFSNYKTDCFYPGGTSMLGAWGCLDFTSSLEEKFGARSSQVHQIRGKTREVPLPQDAKVGRSPNFGVISEIRGGGQNLRYLSPIFLKAKFGAPTGISESNFGAKPPTS